MQIIKVDKNKITGRQIDLIVNFLKDGKVIVYPTDTIYGLGCLATERRAIKRIYRIKKREKGRPMIILVSSLAMAKKYCIINKEQERFLQWLWRITPLPPLIKGARPHPTPPFARGGILRRLQGEGSLKSPYTPFVKGGNPVTVILKSKKILPKELAGKGNTLAVRLPKNKFLIKLIKKVKYPIVSTSLNISGQKNLTSVENVEEYFIKKPTPAPLTRGAKKIPLRPPASSKGQALYTKGALPDLVVNAGVLNNKPSRIVDIRDMKNIKVLRK